MPGRTELKSGRTSGTVAALKHFMIMARMRTALWPASFHWTFSAFIILAVTHLTGSWAQGANLIANGGFEDIAVAGNSASYTTSTTPAGFGWSVVGNVSVFKSGVGQPPISGAQSLAISNVASGISQQVPVAAGGTYTLRWRAASMAAGVPYRFSLRVQAPRLVYLKEYFGTNGTAAVAPEAVTFTVSPTSSVLTVTFLRSLASDAGLALDEIVLTEDEVPFADADRDGHPDDLDPCLTSDLRTTVFVGTANTGVSNRYRGALVDVNGCSLADHIYEALVAAADSSRISGQPNRVNHNKFNRAMEDFLAGFVSEGLLTGAQQDAIMERVRTTDPTQFLP